MSDSKIVTIHAPKEWGADVVIVDEDGHVLQNVKEATVYLEANEMTTVNLTIRGILVNVRAQVHEIQFECPTCDLRINHDCDTDPHDRGSHLVPLPTLPTTPSQD